MLIRCSAQRLQTWFDKVPALCACSSDLPVVGAAGIEELLVLDQMSSSLAGAASSHISIADSRPTFLC